MKKLIKIVFSSIVVLGLMNGCGITNKDKAEETNQITQVQLETPPSIPEIADNNTQENTNNGNTSNETEETDQITQVQLETPPSIPNLNKKQ